MHAIRTRGLTRYYRRGVRRRVVTALDDLTLEHPDPRVVHEVPAAHDLHGNLTSGALLLGLVDRAHPALTQLTQDPVGANETG